MTVELNYAGIPWCGLFAVHYWFVTESPGMRDRWEIWWQQNVGGYSNGYLHRNLQYPDADVGGGPTCLECSWSGKEADRITQALQQSWDGYPYRSVYRAFPGPNSNTYVAWVLRKAAIEHPLSWKGMGKDFQEDL
jgi:hypothetical protein